jgi:hypothetical protein
MRRALLELRRCGVVDGGGLRLYGEQPLDLRAHVGRRLPEQLNGADRCREHQRDRGSLGHAVLRLDGLNEHPQAGKHQDRDPPDHDACRKHPLEHPLPLLGAHDVEGEAGEDQQEEKHHAVRSLKTRATETSISE